MYKLSLMKSFRKLQKEAKKRKTTKKNSLKYASYPLRIKAFITDLFMIYTPILYFMTYIVMGDKESFVHSNLAPLIAVLLYGVIYALFLTKSGQTPGKKAYSIKVVDEKTLKNISFFRAFLRFFVFLVGVTILIGVILPFYNREKKALHDIIAKTVEIEIEE